MQRVTYAVTALVPGPSKHPLLQHPLLQHPRQLLQPNSCSCCCSPNGNGQLSCIACPSQCGSRVFGADRRGMIDGAATAVRHSSSTSIFGHGHFGAAVVVGHAPFGQLQVAPSALRSPGPVLRIAGTARPRFGVIALSLVPEGTPVGGPVVGLVQIRIATRGAVPDSLGTPVPALCLQALDWAAANPTARAPDDCANLAHADLAELLRGRHRWLRLLQAGDSTANRLLNHHGYGG